ncbi:hypothetical protein [Belnapia sp. F-4-1]|uniref:hypothetical protein n=1 Tax=Belnapia sp. F-4-1 TaxID=1545443 RepID=UPI0011868464|nr:hypothetical protein [Belnapia sp. F-4-1]
MYRQLSPGDWATEEHLVSRLSMLYRRERSRFLFEAQAIEDARRSGQQRTSRALGLTHNAPRHRGSRPKRVVSFNIELASRLLVPALLQDCVAAFAQGHKDALQKRRR